MRCHTGPGPARTAGPPPPRQHQTTNLLLCGARQRESAARDQPRHRAACELGRATDCAGASAARPATNLGLVVLGHEFKIDIMGAPQPQHPALTVQTRVTEMVSRVVRHPSLTFACQHPNNFTIYFTTRQLKRKYELVKNRKLPVFDIGQHESL